MYVAEEEILEHLPVKLCLFKTITYGIQITHSLVALESLSSAANEHIKEVD